MVIIVTIWQAFSFSFIDVWGLFGVYTLRDYPDLKAASI